MERTLATPETAEAAWIAADLAPGDAAVREPAPGTRVRRIRSAEDPWFLPAYERLWREFGRKREMEARDAALPMSKAAVTGQALKRNEGVRVEAA